MSAFCVRFKICRIIPTNLVGGDLPPKDPFDRNNVQNDVGVFLPRGRAGFTKATGYKCTTIQLLYGNTDNY